MPKKNLKRAFEIYQPNGIKGKLLKNFFPYLKNFTIVRSKLHISEVPSPISSEVQEIFEKVFDVKQPEISIFLGTPSVHQKTTIQIFKGKNILGYAKISDKPEIVELFKKENDFLDSLADVGVENIPKPLYLGELNDGSFLFIQDTKKKPNSKSPVDWTIQHENLLKDLRDKSLHEIAFEQSSLYTSLSYLNENLHRIPEVIPHSVIPDSIEDILREFAGKKVTFSAYHADFTPWNMFLLNGELYVFDWEYSSKFYPADIDKYHFHMQQWIHVKHWDEDKIFEEINKLPWFDPFIFKIYLTDIISRYLKREEEILSNSFINSLKLWVRLLQKVK